MSVTENLRRDVLFGEGEDERKEQTSGTITRHRQGLYNPSRREKQGVFGRLSSREGEKVGRFAQHVYSRFRRPLQRAVLFDADY